MKTQSSFLAHTFQQTDRLRYDRRSELVIYFAEELYLHADIPRTPDNGAQVAHAIGIAHNVDTP